MEKSKQKQKRQRFVAQWILRAMFIWAIHIIAFLMGGLLLGLHNAIQVIAGLFLMLMVYGFALMVGKSDANKDYAILVSNRKNYTNATPLNEMLLQFAYFKGFCIVALSVLPFLIFHIIALSARTLFLKGLVSFYFIGTTLFFDGIGVFDSAAELVGGNLTSYAVIFSIFLILEFVAYPLGYILGGRGRILFHRHVEREKKSKSRDW